MQNFDREFKKVWAMFDRIAEDRKKREAAEDERARKREAADNERDRKRKAAEAERDRKRKAEFDEWKVAEDKRARKWKAEIDEWKTKFDESLQKTNASLAKTNATLDKTNATLDKTNASLDKIAAQIGGFTNNYADALEDEFAAALREEKRIGDIRFRAGSVWQRARLDKNSREYDLVVRNGKFVFVGEIKNKLLPRDVERFARDRLPHYAEDFPDKARGRKVLGMIGGATVTENAAAAAKKHGMILLRLKNKKLIATNISRARPVAAAS